MRRQTFVAKTGANADWSPRLVSDIQRGTWHPLRRRALLPLQLGARLEQLRREVVGPPRRLARRRMRGRRLATQLLLGRRTLRLRR